MNEQIQDNSEKEFFKGRNFSQEIVQNKRKEVRACEKEDRG